jgi:hypothetical protein
MMEEMENQKIKEREKADVVDDHIQINVYTDTSFE